MDLLTDCVAICPSHGGFYLSEEALRRLGVDDEDAIPRNSLALVNVVKDMGKAAADSPLEIIKLPPGKYVITDYDSAESVREYHRVLCNGEWREAGIVVTIPKGDR